MQLATELTRPTSPMTATCLTAVEYRMPDSQFVISASVIMNNNVEILAGLTVYHSMLL